MLTTCGTVVRRVGHQEVNRATGAYIAKVVQGALVGCVARGEMPTSGAGGLLIGTAIKSQLGCWEVLDVDNALGGVWYVVTRSKHGWLPWKKGWDQSIKVITCPVYIESRIPATVSNFMPICSAASSPMAFSAWAVTPVTRRCCSPSVASGGGFVRRVRAGGWPRWPLTWSNV